MVKKIQMDQLQLLPPSTPTEILTTPESFFFFTSANTATTGGISGGGQACSAGPVTLEAL